MSEPVPGMVYGLSNPYMPGLIKIGRSTNIVQRIVDLSRPTGVPGTFVLEFAKSVTNSSEKERQLHSILSDKRVKDSEFFKATSEEVRALFALMEGDWITPADVAPDRVTPIKVTPVSAATIADAPVRQKAKKHRTEIPHPELHEILEDGQQVYHKIKEGTEWIAIFNRELNKIVYDGAAYTINHFVKTHYKQERPDRKPACNAWKEIKTMVDGQMIRLNKLERLKAQESIVLLV